VSSLNAILGQKLGMTQIFDDEARSIPVTVVKAGPCVVIQRKTVQKDGYDAVQLGLVEVPPPKRVKKALEGHFKKSGAVPVRFLREVRLKTSGDVKAGDKVLFAKYSGTEFKLDGEEHLILREDDVLGVIE